MNKRHPIIPTFDPHVKKFGGAPILAAGKFVAAKPGAKPKAHFEVKPHAGDVFEMRR